GARAGRTGNASPGASGKTSGRRQANCAGGAFGAPASVRPGGARRTGPSEDRKMETERERVEPSKPRGFAALDAETRRRIASRGGKAAHDKGRAHEFSAQEAREAGRKGGERVSKNRDHMAEIGRKGGERVSRDRDHMAQIGRRGGEIVSENRAHMAEI